MENKTKFLNAQSSFNNLGLCDTNSLCVWANYRLIQKKEKKSNPKDFLITIFNSVEKVNLTVANFFLLLMIEIGSS